MAKYTIRNKERLVALEGLGIGCNANNYTHQFEWDYTGKRAIKFSTKEEAQATIDFIANVIDFELAEQLTIMEEPEQGGV